MSETTADLIDRALLARREQRHREAQNLFANAVAAARAAGLPHDLIRALKGLAQLERDLGHDEIAIAYYDEAALLCREHASGRDLAHTVRHLGDMHRGAGRRAEAAACYREALALYRGDAAAPPLDLANALRGFALLPEGAGEREEAGRLWSEAQEV